MSVEEIRPCDRCGGEGLVACYCDSPTGNHQDGCPRCPDMPWLDARKINFSNLGIEVLARIPETFRPDRETVEWRCVLGDESYLGPCESHPDGTPRRTGVAVEGFEVTVHPYLQRHSGCGWFPVVERLGVVLVKEGE